MRARAIAGLLALALVWAAKVSAHPLGNFSISQYSALRIGKGLVELRYIVDMAEIPTFQEIQQNGFAPAADESGIANYLEGKVAELRDGLRLEVDGQKIPLRLESREILFPEGQGGLPTMKIGALFRGAFHASTTAPREVLYRDGNFSGRAGWKEVIAHIDEGTELIDSNVPGTDRSAQLSNYPTDLLNSPPQVLEARVRFRATGAAAIVSASPPLPPVRRFVTGDKVKAAAPMIQDFSTAVPQNTSERSNLGSEPARKPLRPNQRATAKNSFTELIAAKQMTGSMILFAFTIAAVLGAVHALEPGHGKTLVAAYLIGSRGTAKHALLLGLIVTASHTAAVYLLGGVVLYASAHVVPEKLYPWLALASGVSTIGLGVALLLRRLDVRGAVHDHHRSGHDDHAHHGGHGRAHVPHYSHGHSHDHHDHSHAVALRELLTLGISGGIVPCPAALVVLLSAVSLHRIGFGLLLILAFSLGLAAVLIAIGLSMVYAGRAMSRFYANEQLITHWLPLTSSAFIVLFGLGLTWQALASAGFMGL
jgi:nickel/cobalt exporter